MPAYRTEVSNLTYNPATQRFEALVIFHEGSDRTSYPCDLAAPIDSDFAHVTRALVVQAKIRRAKAGRGLMSRLRESFAQPHLRAAA